MDNEGLVQALRATPAARLRVFRLLPDLMTEGKLDPDKAQARAADVDAASAELTAYCDGVREATDRLRGLLWPQ